MDFGNLPTLLRAMKNLADSAKEKKSEEMEKILKIQEMMKEK